LKLFACIFYFIRFEYVPCMEIVEKLEDLKLFPFRNIHAVDCCRFREMKDLYIVITSSCASLIKLKKIIRNIALHFALKSFWTRICFCTG